MPLLTRKRKQQNDAELSNKKQQQCDISKIFDTTDSESEAGMSGSDASARLPGNQEHFQQQSGPQPFRTSNNQGARESRPPPPPPMSRADRPASAA